MELERRGDPVYCQKLKELLASMQTWQIIENRAKLRHAIEDFMDALWELYLDYFQYHKEDAKFCLIDFQDLLLSQLDHIKGYYIVRRIYKLRGIDSYQSGWDMACKFRSNIEAFYELFGDVTGREKSEEYEELIEFVEGHKDSIDRGWKRDIESIPKSHWWWFVGFDF